MDTCFAREFMKNRAWDFIIAVDRGLRVMEELSVTPNLVVGDFDTAEPGLVRRFRENPEMKEVEPGHFVKCHFARACDRCIQNQTYGGNENEVKE